MGCLALVSAFLPEVSLLGLRGLDGCSCQVRMALSICRRVESLMPRAGGRRHETLADSRVQVREQEPPVASETAAEHPRVQLGGQTARQADLHRCRSTYSLSRYLGTYLRTPYCGMPAGGDYIMTGRAGAAYHRQAWVIEAW